MKRPDLDDDTLMQAIEATTVAVGKRIEKHGRHAAAGNHETLGMITEEYYELIDAVKQNDPIDIANELLDVAVACIYGVASMIDKENRIKQLKEKLSENTIVEETPA